MLERYKTVQKYPKWYNLSVPACDPDGVELRPEGVAVPVGVPVELVVVLVARLDLLAASVERVDVQLRRHLVPGDKVEKICK